MDVLHHSCLSLPASFWDQETLRISEYLYWLVSTLLISLKAHCDSPCRSRLICASLLSFLVSMSTAGSLILHIPSLMQYDLIHVFITKINLNCGKERILTSGWLKKIHQRTQNPSKAHCEHRKSVSWHCRHFWVVHCSFFLAITRNWRNSACFSIRQTFVSE